MQLGKFLIRLLLYPNWKFIKKHRRLFTRIFAALLIIGLVDLVAGCYYYKVTATYKPTHEELNQFSNLSKHFIVHQDYEAYYISQLTIVNDTLHLTLGGPYYQPGEDMTPKAPDSVKRYRPKKGDARLLNEIHLHINDQVRKSDDTWLVAISDLERLDVYNHSTGHTVAYSILFGVALIPVAWVAVTLLFFLIMLLTGNSCPFIYTYNGQEYVFAGEIYSGAVYAPLERDDYLLLPDMVEEEGEYLMKISNQLEEEQHTNLLELLIFDHPGQTNLLVDKYGEPHSVFSVEPPISATSLEHLDVLPLIEKEDDLIYVGKDPTKDPPLLDGIELTFERPENIENIALIVEAKNSYWLDFVYQNFREMLGISYQQWVKKQQKGDPERMEDWSLSQHIPLTVSVWKNGEWVFQDYYHTVGPLTFKKDVLQLDLSDAGEGLVKIKLEAGSYFWEIGYVALGSESEMVRPGAVVRIGQATDEIGKDVKASLLSDDDKYYVQPEIGNEATISFAAPPVDDVKRTIYLHSKGYYHILQDPKGLPRVRDLQEIRKSGNFNQYSNELMQTMMAEHLFQDGKRGK